MRVKPGTRLGPYEIESHAGAGGMGEVYLAKDTRLGRSVAVKVLPEQLAGSEEARARMEREARAVSSLSHPNICALYDLGHEGGVDYLVMEFLEGDTLAERLKSGPLPMEEALRIAQQVVDGLAAAHRQGVIHRDLKPGNVMLTRSGAKLLDFGLAKALDDGLAGGEMTSAPTATTPLTATGAIMGTFQYMSPEQLEGKEADSRSDLFAFGALVYEMLTGQRPFRGGSQAALVAAIMTEQPAPLSARVPQSPPELDRLVARCLAKDPDQRWHSATDLGHELRAISEGPSSDTSLSSTAIPAVAASREPSTGSGRGWLPWALAGLFLVSTVVLGIVDFGGSTDPLGPIAFEVHPPEGEFLRMTGGFAAPPAVSPDGTKIVYGSYEPNEQNRLWLRSLESTEVRALPGTENAVRPFWSPDSRWVGFFSRGQLFKIEIAGGTALPLCKAPDARGGSWGKNGTIVFSPESTGPLLRVSQDGGEPQSATELNSEAGEASHRYPAFLPDGDRFIYLVIGLAGAAGTGAESESEVWLSSLSDRQPRRILQGAANAEYANGELVFFRGGALMARAFDPGSGEFTGEVRTVVPAIQYDASFEKGIFSVSDRTLVYRGGQFRSRTSLRWFTPEGQELDVLAAAGTYRSMQVSPDGSQVTVVEEARGTSRVWIYDTITGQRRPLSVEDGGSNSPAWSRDGTRIAFFSAGNDGSGVVVAAADGDGTPTPVSSSIEAGSVLSPFGWTKQGHILVYAQEGDITKVGTIKPTADAKPEWRFSLEGTQLRWFRLSPDDRWLAYASNRSGRWEIYVTPFPDGEGSRQISTEGGLEPIWTRDGDALYYRAGGRSILRAELEDRGGSTLRVLSVDTALEVLSNWAGSSGVTYDLAPDGRLLISTMEEAEARVPLTAVLGWE